MYRTRIEPDVHFFRQFRTERDDLVDLVGPHLDFPDLMAVGDEKGVGYSPSAPKTARRLGSLPTRY
jgi:hypothetical protein